MYKKWRFEFKNGGGGGSRTRDLLFRREPLYPTELRHRIVFSIAGMTAGATAGFAGRATIRLTAGPSGHTPY